MSVVDELLRNNELYAQGFGRGDLGAAPRRRLAVITCMDARLHLSRVLGLQEGDAHIIRNAGGVVTDEEIRSLAMSQRLLGTREVMLIAHTECGMLGFEDDAFRRELEAETGVRPEWTPVSLSDLDEDLRTSMVRVKASPFLPYTRSVRGFVYDVATGRLREVV